MLWAVDLDAVVVLQVQLLGEELSLRDVVELVEPLLSHEVARTGEDEFALPATRQQLLEQRHALGVDESLEVRLVAQQGAELSCVLRQRLIHIYMYICIMYASRCIVCAAYLQVRLQGRQLVQVDGDGLSLQLQRLSRADHAAATAAASELRGHLDHLLLRGLVLYQLVVVVEVVVGALDQRLVQLSDQLCQHQPRL